MSALTAVELHNIRPLKNEIGCKIASTISEGEKKKEC